jgi:hypothetical protein
MLHAFSHDKMQSSKKLKNKLRKCFYHLKATTAILWRYVTRPCKSRLGKMTFLGQFFGAMRLAIFTPMLFGKGSVKTPLRTPAA